MNSPMSHPLPIPITHQPRIGVLSNPWSGRNQKDLQQIQDVLTQHPRLLQCEVHTPQDIEAAVEDFAKQQVDIIAINGGDGTVQAVLTALFSHKPFATLPMLAVFPGGTTSMIAGDVGLRGNRARALQRLLSWRPSHKPAPLLLQRAILGVESATLPQPLCGMFFGAGGILQGINFCRTAVHPLGLRGEVGPGLALARFLMALIRNRADMLQPIHMTVSMDGQPSQTRTCLMVLVSSLNRLIVGVRPYWGTEPGPLHYTELGAHPRHLLRMLPSLLRGRPHQYATPINGYISRNLQEVNLNLPSGFTLDGELFHPEGDTQSVTIRTAGEVTFLRV